jgi:sugar phosphate isomerase/epimerase
MNINRRQLLAWASGATVAALSGCSQQDSEPQSAGHKFVPHVVGANTAITGWGFFDAVELIDEIGFRTIEVQNLLGRLEPTEGAFPGFQIDQVSDGDKERIRAALAPFDCVTVHLPYPKTMPYIVPGAADAVAKLEIALDAAKFVGAKVAVLHPQPSETDIYENWSTAVERIREWGSMAADRGFQLACETNAPNSIPDLVRFIDEINHDNVGVTLDVGHQAGFKELSTIPAEERGTPAAIKAYNDLNVEIVKTLGDKLIHLHVHDIEPETWKEHKPLIHGFVDYPRLIDALRATNYAGVLVFEIGGDPEKMPGYLREGKQKLDGYIAA